MRYDNLVSAELFSDTPHQPDFPVNYDVRRTYIVQYLAYRTPNLVSSEEIKWETAGKLKRSIYRDSGEGKTCYGNGENGSIIE